MKTIIHWSLASWLVSLLLGCIISSVQAQISLRTKIGQMVMVTVTGHSLEESSASMDTLKSDLADGLIGGLIMYVWSGNLQNPQQIADLTAQIQQRAAVPLLLAIDQEGGWVARLSASNGFASTPTAYEMGTIVNQEGYTRNVAGTMAGWFVQTGLNMNLAPVVDVNVNPASPAIGAMQRSFSSDPGTVSLHASWFIDEFRKQRIITTLKHFPGHGSAIGDSHLGFTDVTTTWSPLELEPYQTLLEARAVDAVMTAHVFNGQLDSLYPGTLSQATVTGLLRTQLGYQGVVVSDEMSMGAISAQYGLDQAVELAVNAGVDILLYNRNLDGAGNSLARRIVDRVERRVGDGAIPLQRIEESHARIMALKGLYLTGVSTPTAAHAPAGFRLANYPNPFNPATTVVYALPRRVHVVLKVYNMLGQEVATLVEEDMPAGVQEARFDGTGLPSGVYFCRLLVGAFAHTIKIALVK